MIWKSLALTANVGLGFWLGTRTSAEDWLEEAVGFWEKAPATVAAYLP